MSLHALCHPWEVQEVKDGTSVRLTHLDLDVRTLAILADDLFELALESGLPTLYLDFGEVQFLSSVALGKLFALDRRLRAVGGRLVPCRLNPVLQETFRAVNWPGDAAAG
jgi:anti-sigma B factor antagonist